MMVNLDFPETDRAKEENFLQSDLIGTKPKLDLDDVFGDYTGCSTIGCNNPTWWILKLDHNNETNYRAICQSCAVRLASVVYSG